MKQYITMYSILSFFWKNAQLGESQRDIIPSEAQEEKRLISLWKEKTQKNCCTHEWFSFGSKVGPGLIRQDGE